MAQWMQSLGCRRAMLPDGGMSSQMAIRRHARSALANLRPVPMGWWCREQGPSRRANACPAAK
jgi:hypothetical protein